MTILYILLFIVCLSTLIMVHEAGHLMTAKIFKVYCFEYAIGFGPRLLSFKRKNGETRFSIRAIPFGGFVSMYGESESIPEDVTGPIDESRSLNNIKKWKRAIIMTAGIIMNFVLALVIFFVFEIAFPAHTARVAHITVKKDSIAYEAGLRSKDYAYTPILNSYIFYDDNALLTYVDDSTETVYLGYDYSSITLKDQQIYNRAVVFQRQPLGQISLSATEISYQDVFDTDFSGDEVVNNQISGYMWWSSKKVIGEDKVTRYLVKMKVVENYLDKEEQAITAELTLDSDTYKTHFVNVPDGGFITLVGDFVGTGDAKKMIVEEYETSYPITSSNLIAKSSGADAKNVAATFYVLDEVNNNNKGNPHPITIPVENKKLSKQLGLSMQLDSYYHDYATSVKNTFVDFGDAATMIYRGLGALFTKEGVNNIGGIIAVGVSSTQILQQNGFGLFLFYWALISVNLGIVNLLPFPGLDGWHFLVTIIEGVTHKEIPSKVKNIVSAVGVAILLVLMVLILIKDIITVI